MSPRRAHDASPRSASVLDELSETARELRSVEERVARIRTRRNGLLAATCRHGWTEREAAAAAQVWAAYAHRVRVGDGVPLSGPALDRRRATGG